MPRYVAFLRGVTPMNAKMTALKRCFEQAGFEDVKTVLSSGNVAFTAAASEAAIAHKLEAAMPKHLGRTFLTIVRPTKILEQLVDKDPYRNARLPPKAKRVVTFLGQNCKAPRTLPEEIDGARSVAVNGGLVFRFSVPRARGAAFMRLIERTFGKNVTTRTWETVQKCARA
jgi:uncharacterized protein (DUF1697 family)